MLEHVETKAVKIDLEIKKLEEQLKKDHSTVAELQKIKDKKVALTMELKDLKKAKDPDKSDAALQKRLENLKKEIAALKQERPPLSKRVKELLAEIKSRKEAPKPKESVVVRPRGVGQRGALLRRSGSSQLGQRPVGCRGRGS